jgi:uncharacterized protein
MTLSDLVLPAIGGVLIGTAATVLLMMNGRVAGISGIVGGLLTEQKGQRGWLGSFLGGLLLGGVAMYLVRPSAFTVEYAPSLPLAIVAGLIVGVGTQLGNGCTSGHGVCGISRFSTRSIVATITFIATGAITVALMRSLR